jgi:hypothetical protein
MEDQTQAQERDKDEQKDEHQCRGHGQQRLSRRGADQQAGRQHRCNPGAGKRPKSFPIDLGPTAAQPDRTSHHARGGHRQHGCEHNQDDHPGDPRRRGPAGRDVLAQERNDVDDSDARINRHS